jgi:hypothetical protein
MGTVHPVFKWLWSSKCQPKQKFFFWLLLQDRLNTRGMLRRRNMALDSYVCEKFSNERKPSIICFYIATLQEGAGPTPRIACPQRAVNRIKKQLPHQWAMEAIIVMSWSIWKCHNGWIFENVPPIVLLCQQMFKKELHLVCHRLKPDLAERVKLCLLSL